jgi:peptidoglycan/xylan/chitin deacetylase (PgdA/CDA1 family)
MARGGMTFGYHTHSHPVLSRLDREQQRRELHEGVAFIRDLTAQELVSFCYPYGFPHTYNGDTLQVLAETGYSMAFTTARRAVVIGRDGPYELPRFDTRDVARLHEAPAGA